MPKKLRGARQRSKSASREAPAPRGQSARGRRVVFNIGSGPDEVSTLPAYFSSWRRVRVDVNPDAKPDVLADLIDLEPIADGAADAVWASHCVEHLQGHEVVPALRAIRRVLAPGGFAVLVVPDLQAIAEWIATDKLHETIYESPAGPVTAHDMIWGFTAALERGEFTMAHRCGFTPTLLVQRLQEARFDNFLLRRRSTLELAALVSRGSSRKPAQSVKLMAELGF